MEQKKCTFSSLEAKATVVMVVAVMKETDSHIIVLIKMDVHGRTNKKKKVKNQEARYGTKRCCRFYTDRENHQMCRKKSNTNCWLFGRGVDVIVFSSHIYRSDITLPQWEKIPFTMCSMFMHFLSTAATPNRTKHIVGDMRLISKNIL